MTVTVESLTVADAWDHIHHLFGVGDWTEDSGLPWWKWRIEMVTRLKARATRLGVSPEELVMCADYCKAEGIDIRNAVWVTRYYYEAKRWSTERDNERSRAGIEDRISAAVAQEMEHDEDSPWISRLLNSQGHYREEVLAEWETWSRTRR